MTWQNPKKDWKAGDAPNSGDFNRIEGNLDVLGRLDRTSAYGVAIGTNAYAVTLDPNPLAYYEGMCIAVKIPNQNTGSSTLNVNGLGAKTIRKQNGNAVSAGNLKAGIIYTMRYDGVNFTLQGEGGEGTAIASQVLTDETFTNDAGTFTGSMPNKTGHVTAAGITRSGTTLRLRPQAGFYPGDTLNSVQSADSNVLSSNILAGKSVFGLAGTAKRCASGSIYVTTDADGGADIAVTTGFRPSQVICALVYRTSSYTFTYTANTVNDTNENIAYRVNSEGDAGTVSNLSYVGANIDFTSAGFNTDFSFYFASTKAQIANKTVQVTYIAIE